MSKTSPVAEWSREDVKRALGDGTVLLVDVREPHEFAMGHIPGSFLLPLSSFDAGMIPDPEGRDVVFSCAAGVRSLRAIDLAQQSGFDFHAHYPGGFKDWVMNGEAVEEP
jgi:rhodanese-related sulfurtransferase